MSNKAFIVIDVTVNNTLQHLTWIYFLFFISMFSCHQPTCVLSIFIFLFQQMSTYRHRALTTLYTFTLLYELYVDTIYHTIIHWVVTIFSLSYYLFTYFCFYFYIYNHNLFCIELVILVANWLQYINDRELLRN